MDLEELVTSKGHFVSLINCLQTFFESKKFSSSTKYILTPLMYHTKKIKAFHSNNKLTMPFTSQLAFF